MSRLTATYKRVDTWLWGAESERRLCVTVSLLSVLMGLRIVLSPFRGLARIPQELFDPPLILRWLDAPPSSSAILGVQIVGGLAALASACGRLRQATFALAWLALLFLGGLRASRGKIMHNDVLLILAAVPFLLATADAHFKGRRRSGRYGAPIRAAMAVVVLAYFFTGYQKVVSSGWTWAASDNMRWVIYRASNSTAGHAPDLARWIAQYPLVCQAIALATLTVECGAPLVLARPRLRVHFALAVTGFHTGIWLLLGLDYSMWIATSWIVLIDWDRVVKRKPTVDPGHEGSPNLVLRT